MKTDILAFLLAALFLPLVMTAQQNANLRYEVMLSESMSDSLKNLNFISCIDVSPDRLITISTQEKIYLLGWGGMAQYGKKSVEPISSFAYSHDSLLFIICGKSLCYIDSTGTFRELLKLPNADMGISAGKSVMYIYDRNKADKHYHLYAYAGGGIYKNILYSPRPIMAVAEMADSLYIASGSGIYSYSPAGGKMNLAAGLQKDNVVLSISPDYAHNTLFFSLRDAIFAIRNGSIYNVTGDFGGGTVKCFKNGVIIFNSGTKDVIRIVSKDGACVF